MTAVATRKTVRKPTLNRLLREFREGSISKVEAERQLGVVGHNGKFITRQWASRLNVDTRHGKVRSIPTSKYRAVVTQLNG
jgi:hypothetical protein